ncbi:unnamed protein product, partial [Ectocarpus fasciculatus]
MSTTQVLLRMSCPWVHDMINKPTQIHLSRWKGAAQVHDDQAWVRNRERSVRQGRAVESDRSRAEFLRRRRRARVWLISNEFYSVSLTRRIHTHGINAQHKAIKSKRLWQPRSN